MASLARWGLERSHVAIALPVGVGWLREERANQVDAVGAIGHEVAAQHRGVAVRPPPFLPKTGEVDINVSTPYAG